MPHLLFDTMPAPGRWVYWALLLLTPQLARELRPEDGTRR